VLRFSGAGVSDVGLVRPHNEDSAFVGPYVALVADGVGGAAAGEVASATVAYVVAATALARFGGDDLETVVREAVAAARMSLRVGVAQDSSRVGMATTLSVVMTDGESVLLGHVGDSRAYLLRERRLSQVSHDHTYVQHLLDTGRLSPDRAVHHPWRHVVLRSLDTSPEAGFHVVDLLRLDVRPGDRLLLCSDGLTDLIDDEAIAAGLEVSDPHSAAAVLTEAALEAGGRDNITSVVLDVVDGPLVVGDGMPLGAVRDPRNIVDPTVVRLG
jgi:PPM family protein phosphatase